MTLDTPEGRALLDAAGRLLEEEGPKALTVRRIAARAGCSTMLVYSRMGGKPGVVNALLIEGFGRLTAAMRAARATDDPVADLRRCARAYRRFARENRPYYSLMFERVVADVPLAPDTAAVASATLDVLGARVQRVIDAGIFPQQDARHAAACLWAANHGVVSLELKQVGPPGTDWPKRHAQVVDAMLAGLAVAATPART